jgi:hypothetical protein
VQQQHQQQLHQPAAFPFPHQTVQPTLPMAHSHTQPHQISPLPAAPSVVEGGVGAGAYSGCNCGAPISAGWSFCTQCGQKL